jgi:hypothetical protein
VLDTSRPELASEAVGARVNLPGQAVFVFEPLAEKVAP